MARKDDLALVASTLRRARFVQGVLAGVALAATVMWFIIWWEVGRQRPEPSVSPSDLQLDPPGATAAKAANGAAIESGQLLGSICAAALPRAPSMAVARRFEGPADANRSDRHSRAGHAYLGQ